jgi:adenine phosphoribosyltransferase
MRRDQCGTIANEIVGGSAAAAGSLVKKLGGTIMGYLFILELDFLKGRDQLDAPVHTLLSGQEEKMMQ